VLASVSLPPHGAATHASALKMVPPPGLSAENVAYTQKELIAEGFHVDPHLSGSLRSGGIGE
jgi:hypothetical protein